MAGHDHPGVPKGAAVAPLRLALDHSDAVAPLHAVVGGAETDDAGSNDEGVHGIKMTKSEARNPKK
jgi:hypothetical protein